MQTHDCDPVNRLKNAAENITPHGGSQTQSWKQVFTFDRYRTNPSIDPSSNRLTASTYGYNFDLAGNTTPDALGRHCVWREGVRRFQRRVE